MRRLILGLLFAVAVAVLVSPADAQTNKDPKPGYMIIRVLLDDGGAAVVPDPNNPNATQPGAARAIDPTRSVAVAIPYTYIERRLFSPEKSPNANTNPSWPAFKHKYGMCFLYPDKTFIQYFQLRGVSLEKDLKDAYDKWAIRRSYSEIHDICMKALMIGQVDEAIKYCDEYMRMPTLMDKAVPTESFKNFEKAYKGLKEKLELTGTANPAAEDWKGRLGASSVTQGQHYTLLGFDTNSPSEAQRRIKVLDNNFKAFFLWHALQGVALPVPKQKLVAVLSDSPARMKEFKDGLDGLPIVSDAFYSPSHDILVISPERLDSNGRQFFNMAKARFASGWNRDELLKSRMPTVQSGKAIEAMQMMMLAVADQYLIEEGDNSAISREGSRQLLAATGAIPGNVQLPKWLESGLGFYFQRAKGPLYVRASNGQMNMVVGLATGMGAPNFEQHRAYENFKPDFNRNPLSTLMNVVSNKYYAGAAAGVDVDPRPAPPMGTDPNNPNGVGAPPTDAAPPPPPQDPNDPNAQTTGEAALRRRQAQFLLKADAASWALTYYLQKTRLNGMQKFYNELSRLPRDMRLESDVIIKVFAKSFGMLKTDQTPDLNALTAFAQGWLEYMNSVQHFDYMVALDAATLDPFANTGSGVTGVPNPMGGPGPGGGQPPPRGGGAPPAGGGTPPPPGGRPGG